MDPERIAEARVLVEPILRDLEAGGFPVMANTARRRLDGETFEEIAAALDVTVATAEREFVAWLDLMRLALTRVAADRSISTGGIDG